MTATAPVSRHQLQLPLTSVKNLSESPNSNFNSLFSKYINPIDTTTSLPDHPIPVVDLAPLTSHDPHQKSTATDNLDKACRDWGFFMVVNHGIPEEVMKGIIDAVNEFFNLPDEQKPQLRDQHEDLNNPTQYGTNFNAAEDEVSWRDFLKIFVNPEFNCPHQPKSLRELLPQFQEKTGDVYKKLLRGISAGLGLKEDEIEKAMDLGTGLEVFIGSLYPPCPNPDAVLGILPHSDPGLLTMLIQNEVGGLQIQHKGKWIKVDPLPNSIFVNICDQLEVFSNGKYKSKVHRVIANNQRARITVVMNNGPSLETVVGPMSTQGCEPKYVAMKYKDYRLSFFKHYK